VLSTRHGVRNTPCRFPISLMTAPSATTARRCRPAAIA
jgi:hypothetical protein